MWLQTQSGATVLHWVRKRDMAELMLDAGAPVDATGAARDGRWKLVLVVRKLVCLYSRPLEKMLSNSP